MKVDSLQLQNFRNLSQVSFQADPHLNLFTGKNAQGKTSILEGLSFLATLRSFRGAKPLDCVQKGQVLAELQCDLIQEDTENGVWKSSLKIQFQEQSGKIKKSAFVDEKLAGRASTYLKSRIHSIIFNPSDHQLIAGEPRIRRAYLDQAVAAEDDAHSTTLRRYQRILEQRNTLLKRIKEHRQVDSAVLDEFTQQLVQVGAQIVQNRLIWLRRLQNRINNNLRYLTLDQPDLTVAYCSKWAPKAVDLSNNPDKLDPQSFTLQEHDASLELIGSRLMKALVERQELEFTLGVTLIGPHRDDWVLFTGRDLLKGHGSQGETRSAILALKLSEIENFREKTGRRPLLLLDDFSSELDSERREFLMNYLSETDLQVFVTSTEDLNFEGKKFLVSAGRTKVLTNRQENHDGRKSQPHQQSGQVRIHSG